MPKNPHGGGSVTSQFAADVGNFGSQNVWETVAMPVKLWSQPYHHNEAGLPLNFEMISASAGLPLSGWENVAIPLHLHASPKRPSQGTTTAGFAADDGTIGSHAIGRSGDNHSLPLVRRRSVIV